MRTATATCLHLPVDQPSGTCSPSHPTFAGSLCARPLRLVRVGVLGLAAVGAARTRSVTVTERSCAAICNSSQNLQLRAAQAEKTASGRTDGRADGRADRGMKCLHHTEAVNELADGYDRINMAVNEAF